MKTLCVYCTRTGSTKKIAEQIAEKTGAELLLLTDGKPRKGFFGYVGTMMAQLRGKLPQLQPIKPQYPLAEYDRVIVAFPIWCEDVCMLAKSFLKNHGKDLAEWHCVATHMSKIPYDKKINALQNYTEKPAATVLSVQTKNNDFGAEVAAYLEKL